MQRREEIVGLRRRERGFVLLAMGVAALGAALWLPWWMPAGWLVTGAALVGVSAAVLDKHFVNPDDAWFNEWLMAALTLVSSTWFIALPLALVLRGEPMATLAGVSIAGSLILRGANEYTLSKPVGGAALAAIFIGAVIGAIWRPIPAPPLQAAVVLANVALLFSHVLLNAASRRRAEDGMAAALAKAEQSRIEAHLASRAKSAFVAMMSHEIRTPLNGMVGMAQAMDTAGLTQRQLDQLKVIQSSGAALHAILNDVLDFSKIEAGKLEPACEPFSAIDLCKAVYDIFGPVAEQRGLSFTLNWGAAAEGRFLGDAARLRQVATNLVSNAIKFTDAGSVDLSIDYDGEALELLVSDTGTGIEAADLERLFDQFVQIDLSPTRRHGGTGLGLAITKALCELMRGRIEVASEPGVGSRFRVVLPTPRAVVADLPRATAASAQADIRGREARVLAAEDNPVNQIVLRTLLEQIGIRPTLVDDGEQALAAWREQDWDVVLMDIQMPVMDGLTAARAIRELEARSGRRRTPIFALTANAMAHQMQAYALADMDGCIAKPIDARDLFAALQSAFDAPEVAAKAS